MSPPPVRHLYVHTPYCNGKCLYCAFYSRCAPADELAAYARLPAREAAHLVAAGVELRPHTVYFGGGTPTLLGAADLAQLCRSLQDVLPWESVGEWSVETTPDTATTAVLQQLRACGVNRLSMGAQCFTDHVLARLGRRHSADDTLAAWRRVRAAGFTNAGLDLLAGLPGMSPQMWAQTLDQALALQPEHLSVYTLTVEPGSALAHAVAAGATLPDDAAQSAAMALAREKLQRAGYINYEISNFALPGMECQHNLGYWRGHDYVGLGPAAASRLGLIRRTNRADTAAYRRALLAAAAPPADSETHTAPDDAGERFLFTLRLREGGAPDEHARLFPAAAPAVAKWRAKLSALARHGITEECAPGRWRLTPRGQEVADAVIRELL